MDNECVTVQERERAKGGNDDEKERKKAALYCTKAKIDRRVGAEAEARIGCKFW